MVQSKRRNMYMLCALLFFIVAGVVVFFMLRPSAPRYQSVRASDCGRMAIVSLRGQWGRSDPLGVIDVQSGEEMIPIENRNVLIHAGLAFVWDMDWDLTVTDLESGDEVFVLPAAEGRIRPGRAASHFDMENGRAIIELDEEVGVIDIESGEMIVPFGLVRSFESVHGDMAVVRGFRTQRPFGVICLESGDTVVPSGRFGSIEDIQNGRAIVTSMWGMPQRSVVGVIDVRSGDELIPIGPFLSRYYSFSLFPGGDYVRVSQRTESGHQSSVIHLESGEERLPFGRFTQMRSTSIDGLVLAIEEGRWGIIDIEAGDEVIAVAYQEIVISDGLAFAWDENDDLTITDLEPGGEGRLSGMVGVERRRDTREHVIIDLARGLEVVTAGQYLRLSDPIDGMVVVWGWDGEALIDLESGDELIPFGEYRFITLFADGIVAVWRNPLLGSGFWSFERIEDLIA